MTVLAHKIRGHILALGADVAASLQHVHMLAVVVSRRKANRCYSRV